MLWIAGRARCVADEEGELTRLLGVAMDVTVRKQVEEEGRRQRMQINVLTRVSLLGEMTASLAHELNQPLSAIISNANAGMRFMDRGKVDAKTIHEILVDVAADARRANEIILNVRNTIKKGEPVRRPISMNEIVENVAHMIRPDATSHCCEVETSLADNLPTIEGDPIQIQEVLINLIGNAFDAMRGDATERAACKITTEETDIIRFMFRYVITEWAYRMKCANGYLSNSIRPKKRALVWDWPLCVQCRNSWRHHYG